MKAITIPSGIRGHFDVVDTEIIRDLFCVHSRPEGHTGELNLLQILLSSLAVPVWASRGAERDLSDLDDMYEIVDDNVVAFLTKNGFLVDLLNEAVAKLRECFGDNVQVHLEIFSEPDRTSDYELFARVLTKLSANDALDLLDRFDNEWWFNASSHAQCLLNFALRYE